MKNTKNSLPAIALLLSDARGVYIPRDFIEGFDLSLWSGISEEKKEECMNPNSEYYWWAWDSILDNATFTENGNTWRLMQDGDLWAYCYELMSNEERENFGFDIVEHEYFINLDERGEFFADVRDYDGNTIYEIRGYESLSYIGMKNSKDIESLEKFLKGELILTAHDKLKRGN